MSAGPGSGTGQGGPRRSRVPVRSLFLPALALVTFVLGAFGYATNSTHFYEGMRSGPGLFARVHDGLYLTLGLFIGNGKDTAGSPCLMIARWTGAFFSLAGLATVLRPHLDIWAKKVRIAAMRRQTIVIGLGEKGKAFARDLGERGVVVALDAVDRASLVREDVELRDRVLFVRGDATDPSVLDGLGVRRARAVVLATESDVTNLTVARMIAARADRLRDATDRLDVFVHVGDPMLRLEGLSGLTPPDHVNMRPFSLPALAARRLNVAAPFSALAEIQGAQAVHVVFVGFDEFAEEILLQTLCRVSSVDERARPRFTILATAAEQLKTRLYERIPALRTLVVDLGTVAFDARSELSDETLKAVEGVDGGHPVTAIVVCQSSDMEAIVVARRVRTRTSQYSRWRAPMFVRLADADAFSATLTPGEKRLSRLVEPFGGLRDVCSARHLVDWDRQAEKVHEAWREAYGQEHRSPADAPWNRLDEQYRQANRRAVDHFGVKLAVLGYIARGEPPRLAHVLAPTESTLTKLAALEHASWMVDKLLASWTWGPAQDAIRRQHADLVPYPTLGATEQQKDLTQFVQLARSFSRPIPDALIEPSAQTNEAPANCFRERRIALVGDAGVALEGEGLDAALEALFKGMSVDARLAEGSEFWTFVTPFASPADRRLARTVRTLMNRRATQPGAARRHRFVMARGSASGQPAALDEDEVAFASAADVELIVEPPDGGHQELVEYLTRVCDEVIAWRAPARTAAGSTATLAAKLVAAWPKRAPRRPRIDEGPQGSGLTEVLA